MQGFPYLHRLNFYPYENRLETGHDDLSAAGRYD
jgi:hypothetical protein